MSGTTGNIKDRGDMSEKKKRSMSLQQCTSERGDTSKKKKRSMSLQQCTSERGDTSEKKKRSMSLQQCTSERGGTSEEKKRSMSLQQCTSECVVFSDDFISEILIRLPTKALYRCKCVCKSWRSLISEHNFLNNFITRSKSLPPLLTGVFYGKDTSEVGDIEEMVTDFLDFGTLKTTTSLVDTLPVDICLSFLKRSVLAVAAHNGFVLFAERPEKPTFFTMISYRFNYIVCNPITKQCVDLPKPRCIHSSKNTFVFCYNNKGSGDHQIEFKVVSLLPGHLRESKVEVYSSETGKWKRSSIFQGEHRFWDITFMFNGGVYCWGRTHLLVYNVMEETTRKVELPSNALNPGRFGVSEGSLYYAQACESSFWVWVLVDGVGWDLVHNVEYASLASAFPDISGSSNFRYLLRPFGFLPLNHELVLVRSPQGMSLYHTGTRRIKFIDNFCPREFPPIIPYSLPAWLPCLPNTLRHAKPAANARKRPNRCSNARVA